jgi:putative endonuclease
MRPQRTYIIYILTNRSRTLYIGMTSDLSRRVSEHLTRRGSAFTTKYLLDRLVYYEIYADPETAVIRERQMKKWRRETKVRLITEFNPNWRDLSPELITG